MCLVPQNLQGLRFKGRTLSMARVDRGVLYHRGKDRNISWCLCLWGLIIEMQLDCLPPRLIAHCEIQTLRMAGQRLTKKSRVYCKDTESCTEMRKLFALGSLGSRHLPPFLPHCLFLLVHLSLCQMTHVHISSRPQSSCFLVVSASSPHSDIGSPASCLALVHCMMSFVRELH